MEYSLASLTAIYAQPDLALSIPALISQEAYWNGNAAVQFDLYNQGNDVAAGSFSIKTFLSKDEFLSADDIQSGTIYTNNLMAGETVYGMTGSVSIPVVPEGYYHVLLYADADDQILESDESNNVLDAGYLDIQNPEKPNITCNINYAGLSNTNSLNMVVQVNNFTGFAVSDSFELNIVRESDYATLWKTMVPPMPAGSYQSFNIDILLGPLNMVPGTLVIRAFADSYGIINEIREDDNNGIYEVNIPQGIIAPDYEVVQTGAVVQSGETVDIALSVKNAGGGTLPESTVNIALRRDSTYSWLYRYALGDQAFPALSTGQSFNITANLPLPPMMKTGHYYLEVIAGNDLNNTNNSLLIPFDVESSFIHPSQLLLGEGRAVDVRQNADMSYTVLLRTNNTNARLVQVSENAEITGVTELGAWGRQTKFAGPGHCITLRQETGGCSLDKKTMQGDLVWSQFYPFSQGEAANTVSITNDGGFIIGGQQSIPSSVGPGTQVAFLLRTDADGQEIWRYTGGPVASSIWELVNLPDGSFGAVSNSLGYIEQKFGFEILRISPDGQHYTVVNQILNSYQGTFTMFVNSLRAGTDSTIYYASNHIISGKWSIFFNSFHGKTNGFEISNIACGGVCSYIGNTHASTHIPANDGGGLTGGETSTLVSGYYIDRLNAQGESLWRRPYPAGVTGGMQTADNGFVLCGNSGPVAYLTLIDADGNPKDGGICLNDTIPPVLSTCPTPVVLETVQPTTYVYWTAPTAADNCGGVTISANAIQGEMPVGDHEIVFTATDQNSNTTTCIFEVSIVQKPCNVLSYFGYCNDLQTPNDPTDDMLTLSFWVESADAGNLEVQLLDIPGATPVTASFNTSISLDYPMSDISPYLTDGLLTLQVTGANGCAEQIDYVFDPFNYCIQILALSDLGTSGLLLSQQEIPAGDTLPFSYNVRNEGNIEVKIPYTVDVLLSADTLPGPDDQLQKVVINQVLSAHDSLMGIEGTFVVPAQTIPGDYYLLVWVDADNALTEPNEANNICYQPVTITEAVSDVSQAAQETGQVSPNPFSQYFTIRGLSAGQQVQIILTNGSGMEVYRRETAGDPVVQVHPGEIPAGVYFLEIKNADKIMHKQVIKLR